MSSCSAAGGARLRPVFHLAGFLAEGAPVFEIRDAAGSETDLLVSTPELGDALARSLGDGAVVLMRGHGATAVGGSVTRASGCTGGARVRSSMGGCSE